MMNDVERLHVNSRGDSETWHASLFDPCIMRMAHDPRQHLHICLLCCFAKVLANALSVEHEQQRLSLVGFMYM